MNRGGLGARSLNLELQQRLNGTAQPRITRFGWSYAPGDKVIQTVNNYDKEVFNGDIGAITEVAPDLGLVYIDFYGRKVEYELGELDELSLAYATSVHKSQGSEFDQVLMVLPPKKSSIVTRELVYTGITRARKKVTIQGGRASFLEACASRVQRASALAEKLGWPPVPTAGTIVP